jgi:hypothetical protein
MSSDLTVNDILPAPQREFRYGTIRISYCLLEQLVDIQGCNIQREFEDKGVFAELHKKLLLPTNYTIRAIFYAFMENVWEIVVESPDLPLVDQGMYPPEITPVYIMVYDTEFPIQGEKRYELLKIEIEDRWQRTYTPGEITLENARKL